MTSSDLPAPWRERLAASLGTLFEGADAALIEDVMAVLEWVRTPAGHRLFQQGDPGNSMYIVVAGRLVVRTEDRDGTSRVLGDIRAGESVGEMGLIGAQPRTATVDAVRDSVLVRISEDAFRKLVARHPAIVAGTTRLIIRRATDLIRGRAGTAALARIAVVPLRRDPVCSEFVTRLRNALQAHGPTLVIDRRRLGALAPASTAAADASFEQRYLSMSAWLDEQEPRYSSVIYDAPQVDDPWTQHWLRDTDVALLVAPFDASPAVEPAERSLWEDGDATGPRRELVLVHRPGRNPPSDTSRWLEGRDVRRHHHVRWDHEEDLRRLARYLTGNAVGVVLSGGGARAFAHVGVVRALRELGIPIDSVGGTSLGGLVAACVALDWDDGTIELRAREGFTHNPIGDYALIPHVALAQGKRLERALQRCFGLCDIEDTWLPFFCVTTDLTLGRVATHRTGALWKALRASVSIPGLLPPVLYGSNLHVDGGLLDNLPVSAMRGSGVGRIVAVDATVKQEVKIRAGDLPTAVESLWDWLVSSRGGSTPGLGTILMESMLVACKHSGSDAAAAADLYLNPQPAEFGLLDWRVLDRCVRFGYEYAKQELQHLDLSCVLDRAA